jgi:hydrogenase nickel incorporation protein HypA/HybF
MHEFSIVTELVQQVLDYVDEHQIKKVLGIRLAVGELTHLETEQLKFCYSSIIKNTSMEDSTLEVEPVAAAVRCSHCYYEGTPRYWAEALATPVPTLQCPKCGKAAEAARGHECEIRTIRYVT